MRVGPASVKDAIEAVLAAGIGSRDDFYWTLHAVLVSRHEDHATFDEAFRLFWKSRELIEKMLAMFSPVAPDTRERQKPRTAESRVADAMFEGHRKNQPAQEIPEIEIDARFTVSGNELLRGKDFAQMSAAEIAEAKQAISKLKLPFDTVRTRRFRADPSGRRIDPRAMMRLASRTGGELILPKFRSPREVHPPLVVLADISGSMSQYTRIFLHFLHALTEKRRRVHTFVFGTRLTNLTRQMRHRDPDAALADCSAAVKDWSGGTRIGDTLAEFNRLWSRRVLGQGAVVLLITDGLERDDVAGLSRGDGAAAKILPAADLAQSAAALRRVRGAGAGCAGHAAACRRVPRRPQSQRAGRSLRLARPVGFPQCRSALVAGAQSRVA